MLTVTVDCVGSGNSKTCSPLSSLYSVMPSTVRPFVARASMRGASALAAASCACATPDSRIDRAADESIRSARIARPIEPTTPKLAPAAVFFVHGGWPPFWHTDAKSPDGALIHQM